MAYHRGNGADPDVTTSRGWQVANAHPDAPAGGGGPGRFRQAGPLRKGSTPHARSPVGRHDIPHHHARKAAAPRIDVPTTREGFLKAIENFEGNIAHMYLDSKGLVTIGIGFLIEDQGTHKITTEAKTWPFLVRATQKRATQTQIEADFTAVKKLPYGPKINAGTFKPHTKLDLGASKIKELFDSKVAGFWSQLKAEFGPAFDQYPMAVQYALLDMIFNLGRGGDIKKDGKIIKSTGIHQFKKMRAALDKKDWKLAGDSSHRGGIGAFRNQAIKAWFQSAGSSGPRPLP